MYENIGFFEFSFVANSILTGTYGNNRNLGVVFPEMARKIEDTPDLAGTYESHWLEVKKDSLNNEHLVIERMAENPLAFNVRWMRGDKALFQGVGNLLSPDRFVGYYWWPVKST